MAKEKIKVNEQFLPISVLMKKNLPPVNWLIDGVIPEAGVTIMSAKPASLKTWVALQMAIDVALGSNFLGQFNVTQAQVLILDGESGERLLKNRLEILGVDTDDGIPIYYQTYAGKKKFDEEFSKSVADFCVKNNVRLVIIDSLVRFLDAKDENSAIDVAGAFRRFSKLKSLGVAVLLIHHNRKSSGMGYAGGLDSVRGSGDIIAACDVAIMLDKEKNNVVTISVEKNRYDEECPPFVAEFKKESDRTSRWYYVGNLKNRDNFRNANKAILEVLAESGRVNQKELIRLVRERKPSLGEKRIRALLNSLVATGKIELTNGERTEKIYSLKGELQNGKA